MATVLSDFDTVREVDSSGKYTYIAKPNYRAPEMERSFKRSDGEASAKYGSKADVYSLGCVIAEMMLLDTQTPTRSYLSLELELNVRKKMASNVSRSARFTAKI
jgi:serine/threonine protein kinase